MPNSDKQLIKHKLDSFGRWQKLKAFFVFK